jgi:hypothetical protein
MIFERIFSIILQFHASNALATKKLLLMKIRTKVPVPTF